MLHSSELARDYSTNVLATRSLHTDVTGQRLDTQQSIQSSQRNLAQSYDTTSKRLSHKAGELQKKIDNLNHELALVTEEIGELEIDISSTESSHNSKDQPIATVQECLDHRSQKPFTENKDDPSQSALEQQLTTLTTSQEMLQAKQAEEQAQLEELIQYKGFLEEDIQGKQGALDLEMSCLSLHPTNPPDTTSRPANPDTSVGITPMNWSGSTDKLCKAAHQSYHNSIALRLTAKQLRENRVLQEKIANSQSTSCLKQQLDADNKVRFRLEKNIALTEEELRQQDQSITDLAQAVDDTKGPLAVASTRVHLRGKRPTAEVVADAPKSSLEAEVAKIRSDVGTLNMKLGAEHDQFDSLQRTLSELNQNLAWKRAALELDTKCWELQNSLC